MPFGVHVCVCMCVGKCVDAAAVAHHGAHKLPSDNIVGAFLNM